MIPVILAAGEGTRFKTKLNIPKVLFPILGKPMLFYVLNNLKNAAFSNSVLVIGNKKQAIIDNLEFLKNELKLKINIAIQRKQLGTADAVKSALPFVPEDEDALLIICGDTPLISAETIKNMVNMFYKEKADALVLTALFENPEGYGRIIRDTAGNILKIVEETDATNNEKQIKEINAGTYIFSRKLLSDFMDNLNNKNVQKEFYLTDIIEYGVKQNYTIKTVTTEEYEVMGVNTRVQLAKVQKYLLQRKLEQLMLSGITIYDPNNTYIEYDVIIGRDTVIYPNSYIFGSTKIGTNASIGPNSFIIDSCVGNGVTITFSYVEKAKIKDNVKIGPYSHLREGTILDKNVKIGNFVEIKKSHLKQKVKAQHLSYLGDSEIGENTNIGAGTITCNYDGYRKNKTFIGKNVFIGSDSILVAPLKIGDNAMTAAGSTITHDIPSGALGVGRSKQVNKLNWVEKWRKRNENKT